MTSAGRPLAAPLTATFWLEHREITSTFFQEQGPTKHLRPEGLRRDAEQQRAAGRPLQEADGTQEYFVTVEHCCGSGSSRSSRSARKSSRTYISCSRSNIDSSRSSHRRSLSSSSRKGITLEVIEPHTVVMVVVVLAVMALVVVAVVVVTVVVVVMLAVHSGSCCSGSSTTSK